MDYQSNAKKNKGDPNKPEKHVESVVTGKVTLQKRPLGRKFLDLFIQADLKNVARYVLMEIIYPEVKNMLFDAGSKGLERAMFGEGARRRSSFTPMNTGPRYQYNSPVTRNFSAPLRDNLDRTALPAPRTTARHIREEFLLSSREDAALVLERMNDILDTYDVVSVADLYELMDQPSNPVDNKWGWVILNDVQIRQIREGFIIDLPQAEPIQ